MTKARSKLVLTSTLVAVVALGGIGTLSDGFSNWDYQNWFDQFIDKPDIQSNGINVKMTNTIENEDGTTTKVFSYTIEPNNASNQNIVASAQFSDGSNCSEYISIEIDNDNHLVSLTCLKDFDKVIQVTLKSQDDESVSAIVNVDYVKKILDLDCKYGYGYEAGLNVIIGNPTIELELPTTSDSYTMMTQIYDLKADQFLLPTYSKFTKDKVYTFEAQDISLAAATLKLPTDSKLTNNDIDEIQNNLMDLMAEKVRNEGGYISADEIWNLHTSNYWHSDLKKYSMDALNFYSSYDYNVKYVCVENPNIYVNTDFEIFCVFNFDFSDSKYSVGVSSLLPENSNIEF